MPSLQDLPNELLVSALTTDFRGIFNCLPKNSLKSVRGVSRRFLTESNPLFRREFFSTINVSIDSYGLSRFAGIAHHLQLAPFVTAIQFMFDDMSEADVYPETLRQLQRGHTVGILAQCFNQLKNCKTFIYSLRHHDDSILARWFSLFFLEEPNQQPDLDYAPEHVLGAWLNVTIDALFCSKLEIQNLEIDNREDCLALEAFWDPAELRRNHPKRFLSLHSAALKLDPHVQPMVLGCGILTILNPVPPSLAIRLPNDLGDWNDAWMYQVIESVVQLRGLRELRIEGCVCYLPDIWPLEALAENNSGTLTSIILPGLQFDARTLPSLLQVLNRFANENRGLAVIDLGHHHFEMIDAQGTAYTLSVHLHDNDPRNYGSHLLRHKRAVLEGWINLVGL